MEQTNYQIEIIHDEHPSNPRVEWDNLGTMVCFHGRYTLGDIGHGYRSSDFNSWDELKQLIIKQVKPAVILPIYMYDHSGITISTQPFGCRFDSGQIGFIYIGKLKVMKEYKAGTLHSGKKGPVVKSKKQAIAIALSEAGKSKRKKK